jgi:hypothetical protein
MFKLLSPRDDGDDSKIVATFILYMLLIPCVASIARSNFGVGQALTPSYLVFTLTLYGVIFCFSLKFGRVDSRLQNLCSLLCLSLVSIILVCDSDSSAAYSDHFGQYKDRAALSLMLNLKDPITEASIYPVNPQSNSIEELAMWLKARNLSFTRDYFNGFRYLNVNSDSHNCVTLQKIVDPALNSVSKVFVKNENNLDGNELVIIGKSFKVYLIRDSILSNEQGNYYWGYLLGENQKLSLGGSVCFT